MEILLNNLVLALCAGLAFAGLFIFEPWNELTSKYLNFKPFNCVICFALWGSIIIMLFSEIPVYYAFISAFTAEFTFRKMM